MRRASALGVALALVLGLLCLCRSPREHHWTKAEIDKLIEDGQREDAREAERARLELANARPPTAWHPPLAQARHNDAARLNRKPIKRDKRGKTMPNSLNAVKVTGANTVGVGYTFTLAVVNLDDLLMGKASSDSPAGCSVSAGGCSIAWVKSGSGYPGIPPDGWTGAEAAAWTEWEANLPQPPPGPYANEVGFLFKASAGGDTALYKCFGYGYSSNEPGQGGPNAWAGPTEWVLNGSHVVNNLQCRLHVKNIDE